MLVLFDHDTVHTEFQVPNCKFQVNLEHET